MEKRYLRLMARLAPIAKAQAKAVPHLDPMSLYALEQSGGDGNRQRLVSARVIELLDGTLPNEDGERLEPQEIAELVARVQAAGTEDAPMQLVRSEAGVVLTSGELTAQALSHLAFDGRAANVSTLDKSVFEAEAEADAPGSDAQSSATSLYASLHHTVSRQGMADAAILRILRIHAFQTDFSQRVRAGDAFEFFLEEDKTAPGNLGELLATAVTSRGETHKFYRFRTADGTVDFYDRQGSTARKFLMRRPVSCGEARLTSGFGRRRHPMLLFERMHLGEDWACAPGTPIMAAGSGVVEAASWASMCASCTPTATRPPMAICPASRRASPPAPRCGKARSSATSVCPGCRPARTCITRCWSGPAPTAASLMSIRYRSRCRASASSRARSSPISAGSGTASTR
jgi:murein DD-endopeptidase MepM/ murein hydrolase activator NlpD